MFSLYIIAPNSHKRKQNISIRERNLWASLDLKRPQMTSNDLEVETVKSKNTLKGGGNIEINDKISDEILH